MYLPNIATFDGASSTEGFSTKSLTLYTLSSICNPPTIPYLLTSLGSTVCTPNTDVLYSE